jgi:HAE1 family hydrophobic/amphiphilic exporter-1
MLIMALVVLGLQGYTRMPAELNPKVDFPIVSVFTTYSGAGPSEIETLISKPIEEAVSSVSGVKNITSVSQQGVSSVNIEFYLGTDLNVRPPMCAKRWTGSGACCPTMPTRRPSARPTSTPRRSCICGSVDGWAVIPDLRDLADNTIKDYLGQVPGVAAVYVTAAIRVRSVLPSTAADWMRLD